MPSVSRRTYFSRPSDSLVGDLRLHHIQGISDIREASISPDLRDRPLQRLLVGVIAFDLLGNDDVGLAVEGHDDEEVTRDEELVDDEGVDPGFHSAYLVFHGQGLVQGDDDIDIARSGVRQNRSREGSRRAPQRSQGLS